MVAGLRCEYSSGGYALLLIWDPPTGGRTSVQVDIGSKTFSGLDERLSMSINGLMPAQWYTLTVTSLSGPEQSKKVVKQCQTDPRGESTITLLRPLKVLGSLGAFHAFNGHILGKMHL